MKASRVFFGLALLLVGTPLFAGTHVAPSELAGARLEEAALRRQADLAVVDGLLASPEARRVAASLGTDAETLKAGAATLSDEEVRDLAARAATLHLDPVSGLSRDVDQLLVIFLIVAIVVLILQAVD
jgi:hypothetical protein